METEKEVTAHKVVDLQHLSHPFLLLPFLILVLVLSKTLQLFLREGHI